MTRFRVLREFYIFTLVNLHWSYHTFASVIHDSQSEPAPAITDTKFDLNVDSENGKTYNLKLTKAENSVLHPDIQMFTLSTDPETGKPVYDPWQPSSLELEKADNVFVDEQNKAVIRASTNDKGHRVLEGVIDGMQFIEADGVTVLTEPQDTAPSDYIDTNVTLTYTLRAAPPTEYVAEIALVIDKHFGDDFKHDRKKMIDFWTLHFYDANLRFRTIPDVDISLRVTSLTIIADLESQRFIEEARDEKGSIISGHAMHNFSKWLWKTQRDKLPKFDLGVIIVHTPVSTLGVAWGSCACDPDTGAVFLGAKNFYENVDGLTHEIGHCLGAKHDFEKDALGCAGMTGQGARCLKGEKDTGNVMGGNHGDDRFFFSKCSNNRIKAFVTSDQASCLRHLDEPKDPAIPEEWDEKKVPTILEQCLAFFIRRNVTTVHITEEPNYTNCTKMGCWNTKTGYKVALYPIDGSPCYHAIAPNNEGRCFRGRCIIDNLAIIKNMKTGKCLLSSDRFSSKDEPKVADCPKHLTPLHKYYWELNSDKTGSYLKMPYSTFENAQNDDKCLQLSNEKNGTIKHVRCSKNAKGTVWHFPRIVPAERGKYLIMEAKSKKCLKQVGDKVQALPECDKGDKLFNWEYIQK